MFSVRFDFSINPVCNLLTVLSIFLPNNKNIDASNNDMVTIEL